MKVELKPEMAKLIVRTAEKNGIKLSHLAFQVYPTMPHDKAKSKLWHQLKDSRYRYIDADVLKQIGLTLNITIHF